MMYSNWGASVAGALLVAAAFPAAASGQVLPVTSGPLAPARLVGHVVANVPNEVGGVVTDPGGQPLAGAVVSALGSTSVYAVSDREGRFLLRGLNPGPYLVRAHLQGYVPARGRLVQVGTAPRGSMTITLQKRGSVDEPPAVLAAGVGTVAGPEQARDEEPNHDHAEVAWRLRHSKRSVLKEATELVDLGAEGDEPETVLGGFGRAVGNSARLASALMPDLELNGQLNLLTSTSFDRPQELFSADGQMPRGVAFLSLVAPGEGGEYRMRGTITQGDLSSWIVSGSYVRSAQATHAYEAGVSYAMQRYQGGNAEALAALRDGSRNVGALYAFDTWTVSPRVRLGYGARYATYDYLADQRLFSPRANVEIRPFATDSSLRLRASASRTESAPGAVEFVTPVGGVWLPPERTFSPIGADLLVPQRVDHMEAGFEQEIGPLVLSARAFRQETTDQVLNVFGASGAHSSNTGHYHVGAVGDFEATGWGAAVESRLGTRTVAVVDYQQASAAWSRALAPASLLVSVPDAGFRRADSVRSLTASVQSVVAPTETRLVVLYRLSTASGMDSEEMGSTAGGGRFEVQVNQALPFLAFTNARWEALVAVRNMFYDATAGPSVYDEILVVRPPTRVLGGVTVKF